MLVGVVGKLDLMGADAAVRAAFDTLFDRLDLALPDTPKILLSALARGADSVSAQAALAREGWRVVAPLPFAQAAYETDFAAEDLALFRQLTAHPLVRRIELEPLTRSDGEGRYTAEELMRASPSPAYRTLHYEQLGLWIAERSGILIMVDGADADADAQDRVGGTARIADWRLNGPDGVALDVRARSAELLHEGELEAPRVGPVWRIELAPGLDGLMEPLILAVQLPGEERTYPLGANHATKASLAFAEGLDAFNRLAARLAPQAMADDDEAADAAAHLRRMRSALSAIQHAMKARLTRSIWIIAGLFFLAIAALEAHVALDSYAWADGLSVVYFLCILGAGALYALAAGQRWQPLAEDYRALSEALRAQIVLWRSGLCAHDQRADQRFLHSADGTLGVVRLTVGHLIEGARLSRPQSALDEEAAKEWTDVQSRYFETRISERGAAVRRVQCASWFLFVGGLAAFACVAAMAFDAFKPPFDAAVSAPWPVLTRIGGLGLAALAEAGLFLAALRLRTLIDRAGWRHRRLRALWRTLDIATAALAGVILVFVQCDVAALLPAAGGAAWRDHQAEKLMLMGAVLTTALAGAIRFVADKLSWEAELQGYELAHAYFHRAKLKLATLAEQGDEARRKALVLELVDQALKENEAWLTAHRERPLEPVLGG